MSIIEDFILSKSRKIKRALSALLTSRNRDAFEQGVLGLSEIRFRLEEAGVLDLVDAEELKGLLLQLSDLEGPDFIQDQAIQRTIEQWQIESLGLITKLQENIQSLDSLLVIAPLSAAQISVQVESVVETFFYRYTTVSNTMFAQAQRRASLGLAQFLPEQETVFVYQGPEDDNVVRPFCRACVNKAFTREQILSLDNGQGLQVMTSGGGWNCRHTWQPMLREQAVASGFELADASDVARANSAARR